MATGTTATDTSATESRSLLERLFEPEWAGGWAATRVAFGLALLASHLPRAFGIGDAYGVQDILFTMGPLTLNDHIIISEGTAWGLWTAGLLGLLGWFVGGRWAKPGLLVWLLTTAVLLVNEALNIKAYDRLTLWLSLAFFLAPVGERNLHTKWRSPAARWVVLVVFCALYGSTGWLKALKEPTWWTNGDVLAYHMLHYYFGMKPVGVWASTQSWLLVPMCWATVVFEAAFPLLVWWRRTNPWLLLVGALMHVGIRLFMNVGPFSYVALSMYPILLRPDLAFDLYTKHIAPRLPDRIRSPQPA
jgi:hypothetical protein